MMPDASRWRSAAFYDHVETLTASDIAWEWLRRNQVYDRDYQKYFRSKGDPELLTDQIRRRWGLRFPGRSGARSARCAHLLAAAA